VSLCVFSCAAHPKGGEGSFVIEPFGPDVDNNGVADELETIRKNGWLINEANLVFHVDGDAMTNGLELIEYTCMISRIIVLYLIM
jgi:hypothetical protein